jgi:hypothetical protein
VTATSSDRPHISDIVAADLRATGHDIDLAIADDVDARKQLGISRYGVALQAGNGRDALVDAYQEALDLAVYVRQAVEEGRVDRECGDLLASDARNACRRLRRLLDVAASGNQPKRHHDMAVEHPKAPTEVAQWHGRSAPNAGATRG